MTRLGLPGGGSGGSVRRCLGPQLTAYADRAMGADDLMLWDRHLVACACCRAAVEDERRVLASLRSSSASSVPRDLRSLLLAVGSEPAAAPMPDQGRRGAPVVPPVPAAPVRVLDRGTPALHRSARRATVFAGLAAGATAAAAWSLAVTGGGIAPVSPATTPGTVHGTPPSTSGFAPAAFIVPNLGTAPALGRPQEPGPSVESPTTHSAQSIP